MAWVNGSGLILLVVIVVLTTLIGMLWALLSNLVLRRSTRWWHYLIACFIALALILSLIMYGDG